MRLLSKLGLGLLVAASLLVPAKSEASILTLTDNFNGTNTVWTLDVPNACTVCSMILSGNFQDPDWCGPTHQRLHREVHRRVQIKVDAGSPSSVTNPVPASIGGTWTAYLAA